MTAPMPKWHVISQRLETDLSDSGPGFISVWRVTYQIDDGPAALTRGYINVPAEQYNADTVKQAIDAQVGHLHNVASL